MSAPDPSSADAQSGLPADASGSRGDVASPTVPPGSDLSTTERRVFDYVCEALRQAGVKHSTSGLTVVVIAKTWIAWCDALRKCKAEGRYQQSKNGWNSTAPWADDETRLKQELSHWLQKSALDPLSLTRLLKEMGADNVQDDLFADLVGHATTGSPGRALPN